MTKQAQVGAFAIAALLLLFGIFYFITDFGTRHTGYRVGVHFQSAAGLTPGALVYFSGVNVGSVDSINLLPDNTVDVILAVNRDIDIPAASKFLIQAPLTGSPNVIIVPPQEKPPVALLPRQVLPVEQQPQGTNSATISDLLQQGQGEVKRLDDVMAMIEQRTPKLLNTLQSTLDNANQLTVTANQSLSSASGNISQLAATLNSAASSDSVKVSALLDQLSETSISLNRSMNALEEIATNPKTKANATATMQNIADATARLAALTQSLQNVVGDPTTQAQLRSTVANLDATLQRANSLLGELGGTSNVYGVDPNATPPGPLVPGATPYPYPSGGAPPAGGSTSSGNPPAKGMSPEMRARLQGRFQSAVRNLVNIQLRLSGLSPQHNAGLNPVMTSSQGPLGDLNVILLPHATTNLMFGANSIGNNTTWNAVLQQNKGDFTFGGGVLYSQMGVMAQYHGFGRFGLETRVYDLTYPMIDLYGNFRIMPGAQLFFGQRDVNHASRRNTLGLQYQF